MSIILYPEKVGDLKELKEPSSISFMVLLNKELAKGSVFLEDLVFVDSFLFKINLLIIF